MPVFSSVLVQYQTFLLAVNQMHVVNSLGTVFLLKAISDKIKFAQTELCLLALSWPQGH